VVDLAQGRRHLVAERPGDDHHVGLARARSEHDAETIEVVARCAGLHHLHRAAREAERHRPERAGARPVDDLVDGRRGEALLQDAFYSHSSAPFIHSYTKPTVRMPRNTIMARKPARPISLITTAHGKRKAISRSNRMKRIATR